MIIQEELKILCLVLLDFILYLIHFSSYWQDREEGHDRAANLRSTR